jgi:hypothetical protein
MVKIRIVIEIGIVAKIKIKQDVLWFILKFVLSVYSTSRLIYLILRLVNFERLRCLLMITWVLKIAKIKTEIAIFSLS